MNENDIIQRHDQVHKEGARCTCALNKAIASLREEEDSTPFSHFFMQAWLYEMMHGETKQWFGNGVWFGTNVVAAGVLK